MIRFRLQRGVFVWRSLGLALAMAGCASGQIAASSALLVHDISEASDNNVSPNPGALTNPELTPSSLPPQPKGKTTLLGGMIRTVDHVRDRLVLNVFGGGKIVVLFDERTHVFQGQAKASLDNLKEGQRAYVDTTLDGTDVFARNIRVLPAPTGEGRGQVADYDASKRELVLRDTLSPHPVKMHLMAGATITRDGQPAAVADLQPGSLVNITFVSGSDKQAGRQPMVSSVSILASPGATFAFSGRVTFLDLRRGLLVIVDPRDNRSYEVYVDPNNRSLTQKLQEGADVMVDTRFDGSHYEARSVIVNSPASQ